MNLDRAVASAGCFDGVLAEGIDVVPAGPLPGGLNTYGVSTLLYPMSDPTRHAMEAHSDYVQILSEGGIVFAAAALFVIVQLTRAIRAGFAQPQTASLYWVRTGATLGLIAMAIQELTDFSLQMPGNAVLFVLLAAIAMHRPPRHERPR